MTVIPDPLRQVPRPDTTIRREGSTVVWPNAGDAGNSFAAAGVDVMGGGPGKSGDGGIGAIPLGGDMGGPWTPRSGDSGWLGSAAAGDMMAAYPGAHMDHGMLEIPFGPDSVTPAYLTLDATGAVGADFTGHVKAAGLDLNAGTIASPPADNRVRWLKQSDGSVVASTYGVEDSGAIDTRHLTMETVGAASGNFAETLIKASSPAGGAPVAQAKVQASSIAGSDASSFEVTALDNLITAGSQSARLLDSLGKAGYLRIMTPFHIVTAESRTNVAFGVLTTPDRVSGITCPANSFLLVLYWARFQNSVASAGQATIVLNGSRVKTLDAGIAGSQVDNLSNAPGAAAVYNLLCTLPHTGLQVRSSGFALNAPPAGIGLGIGGDLSLGGGIFPILVPNALANATLEIQFKSTSGSITAADRHLLVGVLAR